MASITTVISLLFLFAYCYSIPIKNSKPDVEFTTGKTMINHDNKKNVHLVNDGKSTLHKQRTFDEFTTPSLLEEKVRPLRGDGLYDKLTLDDKREYEDKLTLDDKRELQDKRVVVVNKLDDKREFNDKRGVVVTMDDKRELNEKCDDGKCVDKRELNEKCDDGKCVDKKCDIDGKCVDKKCDIDGKCADKKREYDDRITLDDKRELMVKCKVDGKCLDEKREYEDKISLDDKREYEDKLTLDDKRGMDDYLFTTMDTRTTFEERVIKPVDSSEMMTNIPPSTSVDSFGKTTGLLNDQSEEKIDEPRTLTKVAHTSKTVAHTPPKAVVHPTVVKKPKVVRL